MYIAPLGATSDSVSPTVPNSNVAPPELHPFLDLASYKDLAATELVIGSARRYADRPTYAVTGLGPA